jgi:Fe-S-cluster containining protein
MDCRPDCGACCIAPSISSPIPGMPEGKPANVRCVQLSDNNLCKIFGSDLRPNVCSSLKPSLEMCSTNRDDALTWLIRLENETSPNGENSAI